MSTEANKATIRRWVEDGWNQANLAVADEIYAPDFVQHDPSTPMQIVGPEALKQYVMAFRSAFPDLQFTIEDLIAEGDKVVWRFMSRGTNQGSFAGMPPTGKVGNVGGTVTFHFAGGQVRECWVNFDALGLLQQLGVVPTPG